MKVVLTREWMGRKRGDELNIVDQQANQLIERGTAKPANPENNGHKERIPFRKKAKNRMMKESPVEKGFTPNTG